MGWLSLWQRRCQLVAATAVAFKLSAAAAELRAVGMPALSTGNGKVVPTGAIRTRTACTPRGCSAPSIDQTELKPEDLAVVGDANTLTSDHWCVVLMATAGP